MTNEPASSIEKGSPQGRGFVVAHALVVLASFVALAAITLQPRWVLPAELFPNLPADWTPSATLVGLSLVGVLALVLSPRWPTVGLVVFVVLAYGFPRTGYNFRFFLRWHILECISVLAALGYGVWVFRNRRRPVWFGHWYMWLYLALMAWIASTTLIAVARGNYCPAANHHPVLMFNAFIMFLLAADCFIVPRDRVLFVTALALTLCLRCLLAPQWVKGNGDLGVLLSMSIPLTLVGAVAVRQIIWWGLFVLVVVVQLVLLYYTTNRGGAVAIVAAGVSVWLLCRYKLKVLLLALPVLLLAGSLFIGTAYWQKFADIWQGGYWKKTVESRIDLWEGGWRMAQDNPVFGVGIGNFEHRVGEYTPSGKDNSPHNNIVGMLAETGFAGVLLYLTFFVSAIYLAAVTARRSADSRLRGFAIFLVASLVAYLTGGMFMTRHTLTLAYILAGGALAVESS